MPEAGDVVNPWAWYVRREGQRADETFRRIREEVDEGFRNRPPAPAGFTLTSGDDKTLPFICATCYASVVQRVADQHRAWHEGQEAAWVARRAIHDPGLTNNTWRDYPSEPTPIPVADLRTLDG